MDPFRTCVNCQQRIQISYQDGESSKPLVFIVHTKGDFVTHCPGSRQLVDNQAIIGIVASLEAVEKKIAAPVETRFVPSVRPEQVPKGSVICPSCGKVIRTMKGARGVDVLIQHYNHHGQNCLHSLKPV